MSELKTCTRCLIPKEGDAFGRRVSRKRIGEGVDTENIIQSICKKCRSDDCKKWRALNKGKVSDSSKRWYAANPEKRKEYKKRYRTRHAELAREQVKAAWKKYGHVYNAGKWEYTLKKKYGITPERFYELLHEQQGKCAICLTDRLVGSIKKLCVDHCHASGKVRGLLCVNCNSMLGQIRDDATVLRRAIRYLWEHKPKPEALLPT